jgi:DNA polymerase-3 subunit beta
MVLVKAKRDEILVPLSAVSGIIERRHTLPILSNVLIERVGGNLSFVATDIEIQITAKSGLEAAAESHSITVGARKLLDILRALPDSAEVSLQQQDKKLLVKAGRSRFSLQSLPAEDFPKLAKPAGEAARFKLEQRALRRLLSLVQYAMAQQDIRYYLNGLLMVVEDRSLKLVATDGHRLALATLKLAADLPRQEVIVPRKTVLELSKLLADSDDEVSIQLSSTQAAFSFGSVELVSKLVDGKFPDYTRVIPAQHKNLQRRAGGGARGVGSEVFRRRARHRVQRQLPARRPEQCARRRGRVRLRRLFVERADLVCVGEGLQVRRHADEDLALCPNRKNQGSRKSPTGRKSPTPTNTARTRSRS